MRMDFPVLITGVDADSAFFVVCPESINAFRGALGTVCEAVDAVMRVRDCAPGWTASWPALSLEARAFVVVRPPGHHCSEVASSIVCQNVLALTFVLRRTTRWVSALSTMSSSGRFTVLHHSCCRPRRHRFNFLLCDSCIATSRQTCHHI